MGRRSNDYLEDYREAKTKEEIDLERPPPKVSAKERRRREKKKRDSSYRQ